MAPIEENGDDYIRRIASYIRANERGLAEPAVVRRRRRPVSTPTPSTTSGSMFSWVYPTTTNTPTPTPTKPVILTLSTHHLYYLLIRMEAAGHNVGTLDVQLDSLARPLSYIDVLHISIRGDTSDTLSLASFSSSLSAISSFSLGGASTWLGMGRAVQPSVESELAFVFSAFTKLPALRITGPTNEIVRELKGEAPNMNALPLDAFRNLQSLDLCDVDPRALLGWDRLSDGLRVLRVRRGGDGEGDMVGDVVVGAVVDDLRRRAGSRGRQQRRRIIRAASSAGSLVNIPQVPETVQEDEDESLATPTAEHPVPMSDASSTLSSSPPSPGPVFPTHAWSLLLTLSLPSNALPSLPSSPLAPLTSLTTLDLSSNLLVSVPSGLSQLYNLTTLNLSDNMIDSVLGIYTHLGQILTLNLSHNRLDTLCGLERLLGLTSIDLRSNRIDEVQEISRLATLPHIKDVWAANNPFTEIEDDWRVVCFGYFAAEDESREVRLDGTGPGFYEKGRVEKGRPQKQMSSERSPSVRGVESPPTVAVGHHHLHPPAAGEGTRSSASSQRHASPTSHLAGLDAATEGPGAAPLGAVGVGKARRRKVAKRIVDLDAAASEHGHRRVRSEAHSNGHGREASDAPTLNALLPSPVIKPGAGAALRRPPNGTKHSRYQTDSFSQGAYVREVSPLASPPKAASSAKTAGSPPTAAAASKPSSPPVTTPTATATSPGGGRSPPNRNVSMSVSARSAKRRQRVSGSMFEPSGYDDGTPGSYGQEASSGEADSGQAFRRKIEELKREMGDGWLRVYSEQQAG